ncbi:MarR family transcriptional regulator [Cupriavidus pinatubonensis]|nr:MULTISPECIES: MarR family transcriptional regulator [Cupriavidus]QYY30342.1 MarR family transcriptional regulator [Cupriavidus pinatubonensis]TPQ34932.1 MarR family transcriptional regulator [Cupriavidus pinatubonensis]
MMSPGYSATSSDDPFDPARYVMAESVGYLISRAKNTLAHSIEQEVSGLDITHAQASCLIMLSSGRASTVTDLGRELNTDMGSITRLLSRMEKRGLIERTRRDDDRRVLDVTLTPAGHALAAQLPTVFCKVMAQHFRGFSAEEIEILRGMLRRVICNNSG